MSPNINLSRVQAQYVLFFFLNFMMHRSTGYRLDKYFPNYQ